MFRKYGQIPAELWTEKSEEKSRRITEKGIQAVQCGSAAAVPLSAAYAGRISYGRRKLGCRGEIGGRCGLPVGLAGRTRRSWRHRYGGAGFLWSTGGSWYAATAGRTAGFRYAAHPGRCADSRKDWIFAYNDRKGCSCDSRGMPDGRRCIPALRHVFCVPAAFYGVSQILGQQEEPEIVQEKQEPEEAGEQQKQKQEAEETPAEVKDEDYPELIAGNLTKEEVEYVLAYGPQEIPEQGFTEEEIRQILNAVCEASSRSGDIIESYGSDANWHPMYSAADVNRMFASFSDYQFTEENDEDGVEYGVNIDGEVLTFVPATLSYVCETEIISAEYTKETMEIYYNYECRRESGQENVQKKAVLMPNEEGLYQITSIEEVGTPIAGNEGEAGNEETGQSSPGFPVGTYSYVAMAGGTRAELTIEESGRTTIIEIMSASGKTYTHTYQMSVDTSATANGVITYILTPVDGGTERSFTYNENQGSLYDVTNGFSWTKVE